MREAFADVALALWDAEAAADTAYALRDADTAYALRDAGAAANVGVLMGLEESFDEFLCIHTMDGIGPAAPTETDNIYQATYYRDLVTLFNEVPMEQEDTLVDFGCGLGRVLFYGNSRHYCRLAGIEADKEIYGALLANAAGYQGRFYDQEERMRFYHMSAEKYEITPDDNYFYFFNPFSADIFGQVIDNIVESVKAHPRDIYVMLYYPTFAYQKIMRDSKYFVQKKIVRLSGYEDDPNEKVCVYHMPAAYAV